MDKFRLLTAAMATVMCICAASCKPHESPESKTDSNLTSELETEPEKPDLPAEVNADYKGPILGVENWYIKEENPEANFLTVSFINNDTGEEFAAYCGYKGAMTSYVADIDNDGEAELILNGQFREGMKNHTQIYRLNNGIIEWGYFKELKPFAEDNGIKIVSHENFTDRYDPEQEKFILTKGDKEYELDIKYFSFVLMNDDAAEPDVVYPVKLDNSYSGAILGVKKWYIKKENVINDIENTLFINIDNGKEFYGFTGYKDRTSVYMADLDNDGDPEIVCNGQYGDWQKEMYDHTQIVRVVNGMVECAWMAWNNKDFEAFAEKNGITLTSSDDFTDIYDPDRNKIILKKQGEDTEYEVTLDDVTFEPLLEEDEESYEDLPTDINIEYTTKNPDIKDISDTEKEIVFYRDDKELEGKMYLPEGEGTFPVVVLSCGLQQPYSDYEGKAKGFAENGYAAVVFSFDKYSDPNLSMELATEMDKVFLSETADLYAVLDSLKSLPNIDTGSVYLWGHSVGGLISTYAGVKRSSEIKGLIEVEPSYVIGDHLVLDTEPPTMLDIYSEMLGFNKDLIIFVGTHDGFGDDPHAYDEALGVLPSAELKVVEGADHRFEGDAENEMVKIASEFIAGTEAK